MNSEKEENRALLPHELRLVVVGRPALPSDTEICAGKLLISQRMTHARQFAAQEAELSPQTLKTMTYCLSCLCSHFPFLCCTLSSLAQPVWTSPRLSVTSVQCCTASLTVIALTHNMSMLLYHTILCHYSSLSSPTPSATSCNTTSLHQLHLLGQCCCTLLLLTPSTNVTSQGSGS